MRVRIVLTSLIISLASGPGAEASYAIYVGKNLTRDGSVFLAGYGDEPSSHWLEIVPRRKHAPGSTVTVGATSESRYPGEFTEIPQAPVTFRYLTMNYSYFAGFPAPLTNGGLNEHGVAARDVSSGSRIEIREMTPDPQRGPNYSDLSRIVMERARSAREAVEIVGELIDEYGFSTYGGNSHLFADADEGWILINFAGGQGLWVAERLGPDDIRVSRPGYIHEVPLNYEEHPDFMGSGNLISFAVEQGWYDPKSGEPFHVGKVYGWSADKAAAVRMIEDRLRSRAGRIGLEDMIEVVRTPELTRDSAGYGQVAHLRQGVHRELETLWVAPAPPVAAPFVPWRIGVQDVPPEFKRHRYLTAGEATRHIPDQDVGLESTRYAFRACKRLFYLAKSHEAEFLPEVVETLTAFESGLIAEQETVEGIAQELFQAGKPELARAALTYYSRTEAMNGLSLVESLAQSLEARTKVLFGIQSPDR